MKAVIITIGDEILIGQIVDSNSAWIGQKLTNLGFDVHQIISIHDDEDEIRKAMSVAEGMADVIIMTGGLGPTKDDITKQTITNYFGDELVLNHLVLEQVKKLFSDRNINMPKVNEMQAMVPKTCKPIMNYWGTAPAMYFDRGNKVFVSLPGVPYEMKGMMESEVLKLIEEKFDTENIFHKTVLTQGIGESSLMEIITGWEDSLSVDDIKLAYLPQPGMVRLRLNTKGKNSAELAQKIDQKIAELKKIIPNYFFGLEQDSLQTLVGEKLTEKGMTLATAESCTGGFLAHQITSIPGSSQYFYGSVVAYHNSIKIGQLKVNPNSIEQFGAVSEQVVSEMASGVRALYGVDFALATSGVAGPDGGTKLKPVGSVWIALAGPRGVKCKLFHFGNDRGRNISKSAQAALKLLYDELSKM